MPLRVHLAGPSVPLHCGYAKSAASSVKTVEQWVDFHCARHRGGVSQHARGHWKGAGFRDTPVHAALVLGRPPDA